MKRLKQFDILKLDVFEEKDFHLPTHSHTYYEIIYIYHGSGFHQLNASVLSYHSGDLFFISPGDEHYFDIRKSTRFAFIKFTDNYFHKHVQSDGIVLHTPQVIMQQQILKESKILLDKKDKMLLKNTINNIVSYYHDEQIAASPVVFYHILAVLALARESLIKTDQTASLQLNLPVNEQLISYIHQHIYQPGKIEIKSIAAHFNIAPAYFSAYFKKQYGVSFRSYLNKYRVSLIQKRLEVNKLTLKEIADEFGFTDESHLSHFFKKQTKLSPRAFKQAAAS